MRPAGAVTAFFMRTLLWLLVALALWFFVRDYAVLPTTWLAEYAMAGLFPRWVQGTEMQGTTQLLLTSLRIRSADGRVGDLVAQSNVLAYAYGLPLLVALLLGSRAKGLWWKLPAGFAALLPVQAWGVCFGWLSQVAVLAAAETSWQTRMGPVTQNLVAVGYQFGFLILPTLAPVLLWLAFDRRILAAAMIEGALAEGRHPKP